MIEQIYSCPEKFNQRALITGLQQNGLKYRAAYQGTFLDLVSINELNKESQCISKLCMTQNWIGYLILQKTKVKSTIYFLKVLEIYDFSIHVIMTHQKSKWANITVHQKYAIQVLYHLHSNIFHKSINYIMPYFSYFLSRVNESQIQQITGPQPLVHGPQCVRNWAPQTSKVLSMDASSK